MAVRTSQPYFLFPVLNALSLYYQKPEVHRALYGSPLETTPPCRLCQALTECRDFWGWEGMREEWKENMHVPTIHSAIMLWKLKNLNIPHIHQCPMRVCMLSPFSGVQLFAILRIIAHQAPLSMEFSRQEYCSACPCPLPGDLPDSRVEPHLTSPALAGGFFTTSTT